MYPSYAPTPIPEEEAALGGLAVGGMLVFLLIFLFFAIVFAIITTIFNGIGIMKMHEKLGLKHGWMAFIPVLNSYALGKVAEQYIKADGKKSAKFSVILLVIQFVSVGIGFIFGLIMGFSQFLFPMEAYMIIQLICYAFVYIISFGLSIVSYVALWRVFAIFSNKNATLYLVLSIFVSVVHPFLIFAIRNHEPEHVEIKVEEPLMAGTVIEEESFATVEVLEDK